MELKSKKGYSLIEVSVGVLILTVFLICSAALFNGSYNTYRMIQQRNLATDLAVKNMEALLQKDSNILTGFFEEVQDESTGKYSLEITPEFMEILESNAVLPKVENVYKRMNGIPEDEDIIELSRNDIEECVFYDTKYLINAGIYKMASSSSLTDEELKSGNYCFPTESNINESGNLKLIYPDKYTDEEIENFYGETMAVRTSVLRLPATENNKVFGNEVLKLKVEVFYTNKIDLTTLTKDDVKTITLETVKIAA